MSLSPLFPAASVAYLRGAAHAVTPGVPTWFAEVRPGQAGNSAPTAV